MTNSNDDDGRGLREAIEDLVRIVLSQEPLESTMQTVAITARSLFPPGVEASISLLRGDHFETVASTADEAVVIDERQYGRGDGPCMHAARSHQVVIIEDMATEQRWPEVAARAREVGVVTSLSIPLPVPEQVAGALNVYGHELGTFEDEQVEIGQAFAAHAAVAVYNAQMFDRTRRLAERLESAMEHRAVIEQAKGIIMAKRRVTADEAFDLLRVRSQRLNVKLRDLAGRVVDTGSDPDELT